MGKFSKRIHFSLETKEGLTSAFIISVFTFIIFYFFYFGVITGPDIINESESLNYHIPIAQTIIDSGILKPPDLTSGFGYFPAIGESILSLLIRLNIPLNMFNLIALILLFYVCFKLGVVWGLSNNESILFSFSVTTVNSVLRLVLTQTVDIWLAVFFAWALYLFKIQGKNIFYFFFLGTSLGLLVGVKYSGLIFAVILCILFYKKLPKIPNIRNIISFLFPVFIFGFFWYIRNYFLTGNPVYPGRFLNYATHPDYQILSWFTLKTIFTYKSGYLLFLQSAISEYLFWALTFIALPFIFFQFLKNKRLVNPDVLFLAILGIINLITYVFLPVIPGNFVRGLIYAYPGVLVTILSIFILFKRLNRSDDLRLISLLGAVPALFQLPYQPNIIFLWLLVVFVFMITSHYGSKRKFASKEVKIS